MDTEHSTVGKRLLQLGIHNYTMTCDVGVTVLIGWTVLKSVMMKTIMKRKMMEMGMTMKRL